MFTSLNFDINEHEWFSFFASQTKRLQTLEPEILSNLGIIKASDGFVYFIDGIYAFADEDNHVFELAVADPRRLGLTVIDIGHVSQTHKQLTKQLSIFLKRMHSYLVNLAKDDKIEIQIHSKYSLSEIKEQLLQENSI